MNYKCIKCRDMLWVCEIHHEHPWEGVLESGEEICCGGAGMPCLDCNPCDKDNPPKGVPGEIIIMDIERGYLN